MATTIPVSSTTNGPFNLPRLADVNLRVSVTPVAGNVVNSSAIDLKVASPWPTSQRLVPTLELDSGIVFASTGTAAVKLQDSADNITFADIPEMATQTISSTSSPTQSFAQSGTVAGYWGFSPSDRRYVRAVVTTSSAGVTLNGGKVNLTLYA